MLYAFQEKNGTGIEWLQYAMREAPRLGQEVQIGGKPYIRILEPGAGLVRQSCNTSVVISEAMGIHPSQIPEALEYDRRHGLKGVEYLPDGRVKISGRAARKAYAEAHGFYDRNGGYGDPQKKGRAYHDLPELPKPRFARARAQ
jgi:hypothetical protein